MVACWRRFIRATPRLRVLFAARSNNDMRINAAAYASVLLYGNRTTRAALTGEG